MKQKSLSILKLALKSFKNVVKVNTVCFSMFYVLFRYQYIINFLRETYVLFLVEFLLVIAYNIVLKYAEETRENYSKITLEYVNGKIESVPDNLICRISYKNFLKHYDIELSNPIAIHRYNSIRRTLGIQATTKQVSFVEALLSKSSISYDIELVADPENYIINEIDAIFITKPSADEIIYKTQSKAYVKEKDKLIGTINLSLSPSQSTLFFDFDFTVAPYSIECRRVRAIALILISACKAIPQIHCLTSFCPSYFGQNILRNLGFVFNGVFYRKISLWKRTHVYSYHFDTLPDSVYTPLLLIDDQNCNIEDIKAEDELYSDDDEIEEEY